MSAGPLSLSWSYGWSDLYTQAFRRPVERYEGPADSRSGPRVAGVLWRDTRTPAGSRVVGVL